MTLPNFLLAGAAKAGTTSIHLYLDQHPEIFMSPVKEPGYFIYEIPSLRYAKTQEEYEQLFATVTIERAIGESSVKYIQYPQVPAHIYQLLPHVKLLFVLRNPVDRAIAQYFHNTTFNHAWVRGKDFRTVLQYEDELAQNYNFLSDSVKYRGLYYQQILRYYQVFGSTQIKVYLYDDLLQDAVGTMRDIYRFLEVDDSFIPDTSHIANASAGIPKNQTLHDFITGTSRLRIFLRPFIKPLSSRLPTHWRANLVLSLIKSLTYKPQISAEIRQTKKPDQVWLQIEIIKK